MASPINLFLIRQRASEDGIAGSLLLPDFSTVCQTLELPDLANQRRVSCIPVGKYPLTFLKRTSSGRFREVWWLKDVPDRTGILIHAGNTAADTSGCILAVTRMAIGARGWIGSGSRTAMRKLNQTLADVGQITLHIIGAGT